MEKERGSAVVVEDFRAKVVVLMFSFAIFMWPIHSSDAYMGQEPVSMISML